MARLPKPGSDQGKWGEILNDYLSQAHTDTGILKPGVVTTSTLTDSAVTTPKLADNSVTTTKLADNSVTNAKIAGVGQANGIATLGINSKLNESQVPDRLSEPAITNEITEQVTPLVEQAADSAERAGQALADVQTIATVLGQRQFVVFGDSWTTTLDGVNIPAVAVSRLGGVLVANYGVEGAFLGPTSYGSEGTVKSSAAQMATANVDSTVDKTLITDVLVILGVNNLAGYLPTVSEAAALFEGFRLYPNARYWYAANGPKAINSLAISNDPWRWYARAFDGAALAGFAVGRFAPVWHWGANADSYWPSGSNNASLHMNAAGGIAWANRLVAFLTGMEWIPYVKPTITLDANATTLQASASLSNQNSYIDGGTLWLSFTLSCSNSGISDDAYQTIANIEPRYCPIGDYMTYPVGVRISSGQMSQAYSFRINEGGAIQVDGRAIKTNTGYILFKATVPLNLPKQP